MEQIENKFVLDLSATLHLNNNSQIIRVATESWAKKFIYCPSCGSNLNEFENNRPVADFYCECCQNEFELKSKNGAFKTKINDGAYETMMKRVQDNKSPNLMLLSYSKSDLKNKRLFSCAKFLFYKTND